MLVRCRRDGGTKMCRKTLYWWYKWNYYGNRKKKQSRVYTPEQHKAVMEYIKQRKERKASSDRSIVITKERIEKLNEQLKALGMSWLLCLFDKHPWLATIVGSIIASVALLVALWRFRFDKKRSKLLLKRLSKRDCTIRTLNQKYLISRSDLHRLEGPF